MILEIEALARVLTGERAERVVPEVLRAHPELDDAGRGRVARRVYGCAVLRARLAYLAHAADARSLVDAYVRFEEERAPIASSTWPSDPLERIAVERSAPSFMVRDLVDALGVAGADAFLAASNEPATATLRVNTLKTTRDALSARLHEDGIETKPSALVDTALVVQARANLFGTSAWRDGWFEVQDASSQWCVAQCRAQPGHTVVDLCAGRGGKTLALAAAMQDEGALFVHDVDARALADMTPRLARAGVTCVRALASDDAALEREAWADVVLVDAPCSSWGPLRRSPDLRWTQTAAELELLPPVQREIAQRGARLVKPGGTLVYATCTVRTAENDAIGRAVIDELAGALTLQTTRTLLPHVEGTDGFFVAVFRAL